MKLSESKSLIIRPFIPYFIPDGIVLLLFLVFLMPAFTRLCVHLFTGYYDSYHNDMVIDSGGSLLMWLAVIFISWSIIRKTKISAPFFILLDEEQKRLKLSYYLKKSYVLNFANIKYLLLLDAKFNYGHGTIMKYSTVWILDDSSFMHLVYLSSDNAKSFMCDLGKQIGCKIGMSSRKISFFGNEIDRNKDSNLIDVYNEEIDIIDYCEE